MPAESENEMAEMDASEGTGTMGREGRSVEVFLLVLLLVGQATRGKMNARQRLR